MSSSPGQAAPSFEALRIREARYRALFDAMHEGFCVLEMVVDEAGVPVDYRFLETNPAFEQHTGLVDAVGRTARDLVPGLENHWVETYGRVALTGQPDRFVEESPAMGRWFEVEAFRIGKPEQLQVALLFRNITAQTRAEEGLRKAEWRLAQALDVSGLGTWSLDRTTRMLHLDARACLLLGRRQPDVDLAEVEQWIYPDDLATYRETVQPPASGSATSTETTVRVRLPDGAVRWIRSYGRTYERSGAPDFALGVIADVTAEMEAAAGLRTENEALAGRVAERRREVRQLAGALALAEERERRRIAMVLHEDLQQVIAAARWIAEPIGEPALKQALTRAAHLTHSLSHDLCPPLEGDGRLRPLLEWIAQQMAELHGLCVTVDAPDDLAITAPDLRPLLYHVLRELLFNVAKHADVEAAAVIARRDGTDVIVDVSDEGVGFDDAMVGVGLGLMELQPRLRHVGGNLTVTSRAGTGTCATVRLPLTVEPVGEREFAGGQ